MVSDLVSTITALTPFAGVVVFCWGIFQFLVLQRSQAKTRRIEATRPFLDRQLALYTEAAQVAATLATASEYDELQRASSRFWGLYWGELALVEDRRVESAMVQFGQALEQGGVPSDLKRLSLELARACRDSLAESWGVKHWKDPVRPGRNHFIN